MVIHSAPPPLTVVLRLLPELQHDVDLLAVLVDQLQSAQHDHILFSTGLLIK